MPIQPISYRLALTDPAGHRCTVSMTIPTPAAEGQRLALPAWIPGSYMIRDFARQIETIAATANGAAVPLVKLDKDTWQAAPCSGPLEIRYVVYAWDLSVRSAHLDQTHGFFNGTSIFLRPQGQEDSRCLLELIAPTHPGSKDWRVYTSLPRPQVNGAKEHRFGLYEAPDYDALIDHPIEMGTPQLARFHAHGALHELVFTGVAPGLDLDRIAEDAKRICEAQIAFFEPETRRAPFLDSSDRYVFMTMVTGDGYGGLEHRASTALLTSRGDLPVLGRPTQTEGYRNFLGLVSHEYFHTWHVKRIKPAAFAPYDLARENTSRLLWVFEGFTSYYDDLMCLRAGVIDDADYLRALGRTIASVMRGAGRSKQSVAESSFDAWTRYYRQDENSPNAIVSYYTKGALVALGLDLLIREKSLGAKSLDDVMQLLWQRFGRDFYQGKPHGLGETDMPALILEATGVEVDDFVARHVDGTEDVPLADLLPQHGILLSLKPASELPALGVRAARQGEDWRLATVYEGGAAHRAGLSAHDVLVAIDGLKVSGSAGLDAHLARHQVGDLVDVYAFRRDELHHFRVQLAADDALSCSLTRV
jgi:predicted metalloprotease with PDZ domain